MKKQALLFVLLSSLLITGCNNQGSKEPEKPKAEDLGTLEIHTDLMKQYLNDPDWESIKTARNAAPIAMEGMRYGRNARLSASLASLEPRLLETA